MDLTDAINRLVEIGETRQAKVIADPRHEGKHLVVTGDGAIVTLPENADKQAQPITLSSLSSFASFIRENRDGLELAKLTVLVESHRSVALVEALDGWKRRATYAQAVAPKPDLGGASYTPGQWLPLEDALIWLAVGFEPSRDQQALGAVLSNVVSDETNTIRDDGMAQQVEVKKGITTRGREAIPSPAMLTPYCTFPEIGQPDRQFIVRITGNGSNLKVKLIPSGSGLWESETRLAIADDLKSRLEGTGVAIVY